MKTTKMLATMLALILAVTIPVLSLAEAAALTTGKTYTTEEMLNLAIQDEYAAQAEYTAILGAFPTETRLSNLIKAENTHITILTALMEAYGFTVPENTAAGQANVPATLEEVYTAGLQLETQNITMYETFLAQENLPDSLGSVFTTLKNASQNHLESFTRATQRNGSGLGRSIMNRRMNNMGRRGMMQKNDGTCPVCGNCFESLPSD